LEDEEPSDRERESTAAQEGKAESTVSALLASLALVEERIFE